MTDWPLTFCSAKISIKVIVDKVNKRAVYAETDYAFVDILFSFITLPMGTIVKLLEKVDDKKFEVLGSFNNLYQSLKNIPDRYLSINNCKPMLVNPRSLSYDHCRKLQLLLDETEPYTPKEFCQIDDDGGWDSGVFVSDIATFIVTDDLCVMPHTSATSIRLLTDCGITNKSCLEEIKLDMGRDQILYFLKAALSLNSVFTYLVFNRASLIRDLVVPGQLLSFNQIINLIKKWESSSSKFLLEVTMQKSTGKLLFAEAKGDFVDFLFGLLSIPLGTVVGELLKGFSSLTCMDNIIKSISDMSVGTYFMSQDIKEMLLKPHIGQHYTSKNQLFPLEGTPLHYSHKEHGDPRKDGVLIKRPGLFIVTDDLTITPSSSNSTISTLSSLNVSFDDVEKLEITIGLKEVFCCDAYFLYRLKL
ncbi:hypothetical protein HanXRQr2_Chr09g0366811 [Helianthus annuus]|uniref:DUF674 family protein n=1 Tax=Helianthus annuus TaxID=4232 RepID=A0A9K3N6Y6_HELAN|nr:hypothetical protein HanXRQr2_Chr09g0366811 [Helianthus annuus]KAJ0532292.1 hypothetical protein HanIR_Chr09g0395101 [Helianthus annuus]KAJ0891406.1 hypothetical protein HanPSC8_Chr09g0353351 [Helianthus annuus]